MIFDVCLKGNDMNISIVLTAWLLYCMAAVHSYQLMEGRVLSDVSMLHGDVSLLHCAPAAQDIDLLLQFATPCCTLLPFSFSVYNNISRYVMLSDLMVSISRYIDAGKQQAVDK